MKDFFAPYLSKTPWLIEENEWVKESQHAQESKFAQGNGRLGLRGILEEVPNDAKPGTFIAGLYDSTNAQETELVNLPNPIHFKITSKGEKLGAVTMDFKKHQRLLDMRHGLLTRHTVYQDSKKKTFDYKSIRFVSMADKNIVAMRIYLTPLDGSADLTIKSDIDVSTSNSGVLTEGWKRHFQLKHVYQSDKYDYVCVQTLERGIYVAYVSCLSCKVGGKTRIMTDHAFTMRLKKGQTACFTKIICVLSSHESLPGVVERLAIDQLEKNLKKGFDFLIKKHSQTMTKLWRPADIFLKGDPEVQKALRFNIYHMLICAPEGEGIASVGAKTLSGEGYRGHVFWDTEIFLFPFYLFTKPSVAKSMLLYRYYRLDGARQNAKTNGYKGAQFPWESSDKGDETTPAWAKNFDGKIIKVRTGELEHHIVADIAYALFSYCNATADEDFMLKYGYEMLFEIANFWASRVRFNKKKKVYEIRHVIGPDEFHEDVNNNAYTNMMVKWTLLTAYHMLFRLKRDNKISYGSLLKQINLKPKDADRWRDIASKMAFKMRADGIIEQFDGYFKKKRVRITETDEHGLPDFPVGLDLSEISKTQFLKQADVVMMLYLLSNRFSSKIKKKNYEYYMARTLHKSSLSPSMHAILGSEVGDLETAYKFFLMALNMDLKNIYKNVHDGIHAACLGGVWQVMVNGFGGLRVQKRGLSLNPKLPAKWKELSFMIQWRGTEVRFRINPQSAKIYFDSNKKSDRLPIRVFDTLHEIKPGRFFTYLSPHRKRNKRSKS